MRRIRTQRGRSALVSIAAVCLATGSLLVIGSTASSASRSVPHGKPVSLDHFLCYGAKAPNFATPTNVMLKNALNPTPFSPTFLAVSAHCNPTIKRVTSTAGTKTYKVTHPNAHLLCWAIVYAAKPQAVILANQFGKATMLAGPPTKVCLPSWKAKKGVPNKKPVAPPNLDHFTCYPLAVTTASNYGFHAPGSLKVEDEFSFPKFVSVKVGVANLLCVPTTKYYGGTTYPPASAADKSLVCFPVTKTPFWKIAYDENQFGQAAVFPSAPPEDLCLPSTASP
jgi:hypothetical protein